MKKLILLLLLFVALVAKAEDSDKGIRFFKGSFAEALVEANKQNKPLFVDFYAVWCVPCKHMAKEVFTQEEVGAYFNAHFISPDGKALAVNVGAMNREELLEAAKIVAGESISFEQLYDGYKKNPADLDLQQQLLLKAPNFLAAQEGMDADKWATRIQKLYKTYIAAKKGEKLINKNDYLIIYTLEGDEDKAHKQEMVDFICQHLPAWKAAVGDPAAYYVVMANDAWAEDLAKDGDLKYKDCVEKIKGAYKDAYAVVGLEAISPYDRAQLYYDALYVKAMQTLLSKVGANARPTDYGKAAQDLYMAAGKKLTPENHCQAIQWVEKALQGDDAVMERVNYLVMIGDSYRELKDYTKAREYYNQGFAESLRMEGMEMPQAMVQGAIKQKLATLELLEK